MIEIKTEFTRGERLLFGPLFACFTGIVALLLLRSFQLASLAIALGVAAVILIGVYYAVPAWQNRIYRGWLMTLSPIGVIVSHLVLALLYFCVLTPIGTLMRSVGYDPLNRKLDENTESYWVRRSQQRKPSDYFRQF